MRQVGPRRAFARQAMLVLLTGGAATALAGGRIARHVCQRPAQRRAAISAAMAAALMQYTNPPETWADSATPRSGIRDAQGRCWRLLDLRPGTVLDGADLRGARWFFVDLRGIGLVNCDLRKANLACVNLAGGSLRGSNLAETDLRGSDLRRVDLAFANLGGCREVCDAHPIWMHGDHTVLSTPCRVHGVEDEAQVRGARYDRFTHWPIGFDPAAHGARRVERAPTLGWDT